MKQTCFPSTSSVLRRGCNTTTGQLLRSPWSTQQALCAQTCACVRSLVPPRTATAAVHATRACMLFHAARSSLCCHYSHLQYYRHTLGAHTYFPSWSTILRGSRSYVNPEKPVTSYLTPLTGVTRDLLESKGVPLASALVELRRVLPPTAVLVGQNILKDVQVCLCTCDRLCITHVRAHVRACAHFLATYSMRFAHCANADALITSARSLSLMDRASVAWPTRRCGLCLHGRHCRTSQGLERADGEICVLWS